MPCEGDGGLMVTVWGKLASSSLKAQRLAATGLSQHWALSRPDLLAIFYTLDPPLAQRGTLRQREGS